MKLIKILFAALLMILFITILSIIAYMIVLSKWIFLLWGAFMLVILKVFIMKIDRENWQSTNYGTCRECKKNRATTDYNGRQYYVCKKCDDRLSNFFDEEYR